MSALSIILGGLAIVAVLLVIHAVMNNRTFEQSVYYWKIILSGGEVKQMALKPNIPGGNLENFCFTRNAVNPTAEVAMKKCAVGSAQPYSYENIRPLGYDAPIAPENCSFFRQTDEAWNKQYVGDCSAPPTYWRPA